MLQASGFRLQAKSHTKYAACSMQPVACRGFTFVELLIVVAIFSLLSLAVYTTFSSGIRLWRRIQDTNILQRRVFLGLERISQDLRQALDFSKIGFSGKINEVSFPFLSAENEILRVTYFLEEKTLYRKQESFKDIIEEKENPKIKSMVSDIDDLKFSFAYQEEDKKEYTWKDTWDKEEGIPKIIKMELKAKDANFTKTVTIPTS
jgi:prepilin-type N-terminal cleavage/methylation domain-containing protein